MSSTNDTLNNSTTDSTQIQFYDLLINIVGLSLIGVFAMFSNIFALIIILKNQQLQTPCFLLIAGDCLCSFFMSLGFFGNGVQEIGLLLNFDQPQKTRLACFFLRTFFVSFGVQLSELLMCFIGLDRLLCIIYPISYRRFGKSYVYASLIFSFIYTLSSSVADLFIKSPPGLLAEIECHIVFSSLSSNYLAYYADYNLICCVLCVLIYLLMLTMARYRIKNLSNQQNNNNSAFIKTQLAIMPIVKFLMTFYILTGVLLEIGLAIVSQSIKIIPYLPRFYYYASIIKASSSLAEILALIFGSRQFRKCARKMICRSNVTNEVQVLNTTWHRTSENSRAIGPRLSRL